LTRARLADLVVSSSRGVRLPAAGEDASELFPGGEWMLRSFRNPRKIPRMSCSRRAAFRRVALAALFIAAPGLARGAPAQDAAARPPYHLERVRGIEQFPQDEGLRELLAQNGFAVVPRRHLQIFSPYDDHDCTLPPFITVESAFRTYQVVLEEGLRLLERVQARRLLALSSRCVERIAALECREERWTKARTRLLAWAAVGLALQGGSLEALPRDARGLATAELERIEAGRLAPLLLFERRGPFPYGSLRPTGLYAREPALAAYFRAAKWFGLVGFHLETAAAREEAPSALLLALALHGDEELLRLAGALADPVGELLGPADDTTLLEAVEVLRSLLPSAGEPGNLERDELLPRFLAALRALPRPRIDDRAVLRAIGERPPRTLRLLPPRFTWEPALLDELGQHGYLAPRPLHVLTALGDTRAAEILRREGASVAELTLARKAGAELRRLGAPSVHAESVEALAELFLPPPAGAPPFARTEAWRAQCTWAALGSWTCLRHAWVLHLKNETAFFYGLTVRPSGYVAPYPRLFERLGAAAARASRLLARHGAFEAAAAAEEEPDDVADDYGVPDPARVQAAFGELATLLERLAAMSRKQLRGEPLDGEERWALAKYGERLGWLHFYDSDNRLYPRDDMPLAAHFATIPASGEDLYTAIGRALEVFVIRPAPAEEVLDARGLRQTIPAALQLYRGATFSVYEPRRPAWSERLSDAAWRELLDGPEAPPFPAWAGEFLRPIRATTAERLGAGEWIPEARESREPGIGEAALEGYFRARRPGEQDAGWRHLDLFLEQLEAAEAARLIELAPRIGEPRHLTALAAAFDDKAPAETRARLFAEAPAGHPHLVILALYAIDERGSLEHAREVLGSSETGRWARAAFLGRWLEVRAPPGAEDASEADGEETAGARTAAGAPEVASACEELSRLAAGDPSFLVRAQAVHALRQAPCRSRAALLKGLADPSPAVRTMAALAARDDPLLLPASSAVLWYLVDPLVRDRTREEGEAFDRLAEHLPTGRLLYDSTGAGPLISTLFESLPGELTVAFDAYLCAEDPASPHWGSLAKQLAPELWRELVAAIARDPARPLEERRAILEKCALLPLWAADPALARLLEPLLEGSGGDDLLLVEPAARAIFTLIYPAGETLQGAERSVVIERARAALEGLGREAIHEEEDE
jgi:hypothetical protein